MSTVEPIEQARGRRRVSLATIRSIPNLGIYAGLAVILAGCGLLALAWGRVAGFTNVGLQIPYLISAGCVGLGLVAAGLAIVSVAVKVTESRARADQLDELHDALVAIREAIEEQR